MKDLQHLLDSNREWASEITERNPDFFSELSALQKPNYLWIGCSDSRVPANQIVGLVPGDIFVHRNVANVVIHTDLNCLSVIQYAVEVLGIENIIVCGHYGCGGVRAAQDNRRFGLIDNWLRHIQAVQHKHAIEINAIPDDDSRWHRLCELNVIEQALNVCQTTVVSEAWARGQTVSVHAWIYDLHDGIIRVLHEGIDRPEIVQEAYHAALRHRVGE